MKTKSVIIKATELKTFSEKLFGLMFRQNIKPVYFATRYGIHTFFVRQPIDIIILDDKYQVRKIKSGLPPGRVYFWNIKYKNVLELPRGQIKKSNILIGDKIIPELK